MKEELQEAGLTVDEDDGEVVEITKGMKLV